MIDELSLLPTKVRPPGRRPDGLLRTRLTDALLENSQRKLLLVIAPAGYGKTTLLADFAEDAPFSVAWLTLDPADRDPRSFVEYVIAAIQQRFPDCGRTTLDALRAAPDITMRSAALARTLAADVYRNVPGVCMLVLDDFHEVNDSAPVTTFLDELLRLVPENLRVLVAGRTLPNLTVSRLAVEDNLYGLGEGELRFTSEEIQALFRLRYAAEISSRRRRSWLRSRKGGSPACSSPRTGCGTACSTA